MEKKNYNFILWLRVIASFLVVNLHLIGTTYLGIHPLNISSVSRRVFDYLFSLSHVAVPIFFIITGFLYLDKNKECTYKKILKNFKKYFIYLLIVGTFYSTLLIMFPNKNITFAAISNRFHTLTPIIFIDIVRQAIISVFECKNQFSHMWFLYSLLKIYLILPIIKSFCEKDNKNIYILIVLMFISKYVIGYINLLFGVSIYNLFDVHYEFIYVVIGGVLSANFEMLKRKTVRYSFITLFILINILYIAINKNFSTSYDNIIILLLATSLFIICMGIDVENKYIEKISNVSLQIYLFHPLLLQIMIRTLKVNVLNPFYFFSLLFIYLIIFAICHLLFGLRKNKYK